MGSSGSAYLAYGYPLGPKEELDGPEWLVSDDERYDDYEIGDAIADCLGLPQAEYGTQEWRSRNLIVKSFGVSELTYGHHNYPLYAVVASESVYHSLYWASNTRIDLDLAVYESYRNNWDVALEDTLALIGFEIPNNVECGWFLAAEYG